MRPMLRLMLVLMMLTAARAMAQAPQPTEENFRKHLGMAPSAKLEYRDLDCKKVDFAGFVAGMSKPGAHADVDRAADGSAVTMTVRLRGLQSCPSPYPPVTAMPAFDLKDLGGKRVTSASFRGKPTLVSFFFAGCVPCILEVQPINRFAAAHPQMNFVAMTPDAPGIAQEFVKRFDLRWRVVPGADDFIQRMRVKQYPLMALFDANGKLLGTKVGGARDDLEAANVEPQLKRWIEGLLHP